MANYYRFPVYFKHSKNGAQYVKHLSPFAAVVVTEGKEISNVFYESTTTEFFDQVQKNNATVQLIPKELFNEKRQETINVLISK